MNLTNLKECIESAADVVSTASTTLGPEGSEKTSIKHGSDFGDVFKKDSNETMQRWISSNTVYEFDDVEAPALDPSEASTGDVLTVYESDSDSDIENELVRVLFNDGKKRKEKGDLQGAERHLRNCLSRFPSTTSYTSLASSQSKLNTGVSKAELLELLTDTYCLQGAWTRAKSTMKEKLAITERQTGNKSERFLWDSFRLCQVLMNTNDYTEAQLHGRKSLKGFRRMRESGYDGYEKTLVLLIQLCNEGGNLEDEEAYAALLGSFRANLESRQPVSEIDFINQDLVSPSEVASPQDFVPIESLERVSEDVSLPTSRHVSEQSTSSGPQNAHSKMDVQQQIDLSCRDKAAPLELLTFSTTLADVAPKVSDVPSVGKIMSQELLIASPSGLASASKGKTPEFRTRRPSPTVVTSYDKSYLSDLSTADAEENSSKDQPFRPPIKSAVSDETVLAVMSKKTTSGSSDILPKATSAYQNMLVKAEPPDKEETLSYTKLLVTLCEQELGKKPVFMIGRGREGYNCIVFADASQKNSIAKVTGCKTKEKARHDAASKAYKTLVALSTHSESTTLTSNVPDKVPDMVTVVDSSIPSEDIRVDPPAYTADEIPSHLSSPVDHLQSIPEILVSPTLNDASFKINLPDSTRQPLPVRRAVSDSRLPWHKSSSAVPSLNVSKSSSESPGGPAQAIPALAPSTHRRAASTSTRVPDWTFGAHKTSGQSSSLLQSDGSTKNSRGSDQNLKSPSARPNVSFDAIESSVERPGHSYPDPAMPSSRGFSLLPTALSKTFSLQDRRSKSDDASLAKKRSLRFTLMGSSSKRKSPTTPAQHLENPADTQTAASTSVCPICARGLHSFSEDEAWIHVDSCLGNSSPQTIETAYELPASEPIFTPVELPAISGPSTLHEDRVEEPALPRSPVQDQGALLDLHRAFSKRDLSANKFEPEDGTSRTIPPVVSTPKRPELKSSQRQVLLLGDAQCGKTWLSR